MTRVAELTVEELMDLLKREMQDLIRDAVQDAMTRTGNLHRDQMAILDIPSLDVGEWPARLTLLSREDMYDSDGR
jgi:hypothetical protein